MIDGIYVGTKRVYTVNPNSVEQNTAYRGSEFSGNAIAFLESVMLSVNNTEFAEAFAGETLLIANNYFYQFGKETLIAEAVVVTPNLGVTEKTISDTDVPITADTLSPIVVSHTLSTAIGALEPSLSDLEVSCTVENTEAQTANCICYVYADDIEVSNFTFTVTKNAQLNFFHTFHTQTTIPALATLSVKFLNSKDGNILAPIEILVRRRT